MTQVLKGDSTILSALNLFPHGLCNKAEVGQAWKQNSRKSYSFEQRSLAGV